MKGWIHFVLLALACTRGDASDALPAPHPAPVTPPPAQPTQPIDDVTIAQHWLDALRDGDLGQLVTNTRYPFEVHVEGGTCGVRNASGPDEVPAAAACLSEDKALLDLLRTHESGSVEALPEVHRAAWAKKWGLSPTPDHRVVTSFFERSNARVAMDLWVLDGGVRGVWKTGLVGSREIEVARQWLDAVKNRDIGQLAQLTSYPFELRDKRRDAQCGKRAAKDRAALASTVDCLLHSDLLHRALVDSPSPGFSAHEPSDSLANWIEPWWRENEHRALQRVATMVATPDGYEFDFQMLVARDGVKVVWKLGSLESTD